MYGRFCPEELARAGYLFTSGDALTATGVLAANWVLFNPGLKGRDLYVFEAVVVGTIADLWTLKTLDTDPAITAGTKPTNMRLGDTASDAVVEAQAVAAPTAITTVAAYQLNASGPFNLICRGAIVVPPKRGLLVTIPAVAASGSVKWLWAEIPPEWFEE
jgi:hypothetical protein